MDGPLTPKWLTEVDHVTLYAIKPISGLSQNEKHKWAILKLKTITLSQIGDEPQNGPFSFCNGENRPFWDFFSEFRWWSLTSKWPGKIHFFSTWNGPFWLGCGHASYFCHIHVGSFRGQTCATFDRDLVMTLIWPLDWRMEAKRRRFWNFFESASYWKFCTRWWITNWKNCPNRKWRLWNIVGCIGKSKRNPRTKIWLVIWWIEIIKCSMVLEY